MPRRLQVIDWKATLYSWVGTLLIVASTVYLFGVVAGVLAFGVVLLWQSQSD